MPGQFKSIEQHIQESVFPCPNTGCWWWAGTMSPTGYGQLSSNHKSIRAHRAIYEHYKGVKLSPDIFLCHTCDNKSCVNPDHLFPGNAKINADDLVKKNMHLKGEKVGTSKLKEQEVIEIKKALAQGASINTLANQSQVHRDTIYHILIGKTWKHVTI